jgi:hypothetical protein
MLGPARHAVVGGRRVPQPRSPPRAWRHPGPALPSQERAACSAGTPSRTAASCHPCSPAGAPRSSSSWRRPCGMPVAGRGRAAAEPRGEDKGGSVPCCEVEKDATEM